MVISWRIKILAKMLLSRLPFGYSIWQKMGLFRHGKMDQSFYISKVFSDHCNRSEVNSNLNGRVILEIGPGDSIATALLVASLGGSTILIDSGDYATKDVAVYIAIAEDLRKLGYKSPDISSSKSFSDILKICNARYLTSGRASLETLPANSVDLIFSQAVLEHVRKDDFLQTMIECKRVLKEGGLASHCVDLKDHLGGGLNNLRFENKIWESNFFYKSGFYTNRIRFSQMILLMIKAGFIVKNVHAKRWSEIPIARHKLSSEFSQLSDDDLLINEFEVVIK
jgi:SAM-dependent methyltransferase